ncbi:MAG: phosphopentomutase [Erysipelotrichaceae bacterium]|nr:phosphopentomutase [Erysipelotrichaceae bacterium]
MDKQFKRVCVIVIDSVGIGAMPDAYKFGDEGASTVEHIALARENGLALPTLGKLGFGNLTPIKGTPPLKDHPQSYVARLHEASKGKDTMTGHWELMGLLTNTPFQTFTETGFPQQLIDEIEKQTGYKVIGNYAASGTEIIKELGEQQMAENSLIVYTSADSVLQICAHEEVTGLDNLYKACEIVREICMDSRWMVGRVIARPFVGDSPENFKRTPNRHDWALSPSGETVLDLLKNNGYLVSGIGKINDIFNSQGISETQSIVSNEDGMDKIIDKMKNSRFTGLLFANLVEFDSEYGHRRDPEGYGLALEAFDERLSELIPHISEDDLLIVTADHGNDPTFKGTDHTREMVPFVAYSPRFKNGKHLADRKSFADLGATILANFDLDKTPTMIGEIIEEVLND